MSTLDFFTELNTNAPVTLHIFAVTFIVVTGFIGNGIIIYIQMRKQSLKEIDIYILALALDDLFACLVFCPQMAFLNQYIDEYKKGNFFALEQYVASFSLMMLCSLSLLTAIALNRMLAVFRPYTFNQSNTRAKLIVAFILGISLVYIFMRICLSQYMPNGSTLREGFIIFLACAFLGVTSMAYVSIAVKIYRQKRKISPRADTTTDTNRTNLADPIYRKTLKMYFFTTVLFLLSSVPIILVISKLTELFYIQYISFINHTANVVVYSCFNADFRKEIVNIWKNIKSAAFRWISTYVTFDWLLEEITWLIMFCVYNLYYIVCKWNLLCNVFVISCLMYSGLLSF